MLTKHTRIRYAAKAVERLIAAGTYDLAYELLDYIADQFLAFGLSEPSGEDRRQLLQFKKQEVVGPFIQGIISTGAQSVDFQSELYDTAKLAACLLADRAEDQEILQTILLASCDQHLFTTCTLAGYGVLPHPSTSALPMAGIAALQLADVTYTVARARNPRDGFATLLSSGLLLPAHLHCSKHAQKKTRILSEHEVIDEDTPHGTPANAVRVHDRILSTMKAGQIYSGSSCDALSTGSADRHLQPVLELIEKSVANDVTGINIAIRTKAALTAAGKIVDALAAKNFLPIVIDEDSNPNEILVSLVVSQLKAFRSTEVEPVLIITDDADLITAIEEEHDDLAPLSPQSEQGPARYDITCMTPQKVLLGHLLNNTVTPSIWLLPEEKPVTAKLLSVLSGIHTMPQDDTAERASAILRLAGSFGLELPHSVARRLASFVANPNEIAGAIRAAALTNNVDGLEAAVRSIIVGSKIHRSLPPRGPEAFDIRLVNTVEPLADIISTVVENKDKPISILLHGAPGTSKTTLAQYMADEMGLPLLMKRASDILGRYVGDTEKAIAAAFQDAQAQNAFLLFDEVDSLLSKREGARNLWEKTQVNEMLTWMNSHPLPFACTTNFLDQLDGAAVRRFTLRYELKPLDTERARLAWTSVLGLSETTVPQDRDLEALTVADFANVARKASLFKTNDPAKLLTWLRQEREDRGEKVTQFGFL
ncbi:ATP-binding protein [Microvirga tunisiensis]|uniref:AAA family ATPase n=1 Tax=Microvirga tunisiensis TaxID=2108360 RepID=A0A5N7MIP9_9HYPH|nr:ATP-binding protein [Microvirga tunisiensis]MPR05616.1 AAA family ATPase [Microvirga tunisiensis]MPR23816.1 AAA family ATPase [Microvirga tunisiensis]